MARPSGKVLPSHADETIAGPNFDTVRERRLDRGLAAHGVEAGLAASGIAEVGRWATPVVVTLSTSPRRVL